MLLYQEMNSRQLCDILGLTFGYGSYKPVTEWIRCYTETTVPRIETELDVVLASDNEQKLGRTYTTSVHSNITTSCICMVVSFELKLPQSIQNRKDGVSSTWRLTEREFEQSQRVEILQKALNGREPVENTQ